MGKIRRSRVKRHIEAVKSESKNDDTSNCLPNQSKLPAIFPVNNLFQLSGEQANSSVVLNEQSLKEEQTKFYSKKDRKKDRHEKFLKKLHASQQLKVDGVKTKQRQQTVITGDLNPLKLALLDIKNLSSSKKTKKKRIHVKKGCKKPTKNKQDISDIEKFQQVLAHPAFQCNPLATIEEHVKNVIKNECSNT